MIGMKEYPDKYFDLAVVDPPYGLDIMKNYSMQKGENGFVKRDYSAWDKIIPNRKYFRELFRVSKNQIIWGGNYYTRFLPASSCWLFWYKLQDNFSFGDGEMAFTSFKSKTRIIKISRGEAAQENRIHFCQKPVKLYKQILSLYALNNYKILDTHVGSASSLIACEDMGFEYVGFEINKDYYEAACKRLEQFRSQLKLAI